MVPTNTVDAGGRKVGRVHGVAGTQLVPSLIPQLIVIYTRTSLSSSFQCWNSEHHCWLQHMPLSSWNSGFI